MLQLRTFYQTFLGDAPDWYKQSILAFLVLNPIVAVLTPADAGYFFLGWVLLLQFIFVLAMALYSYPLQAGGLLAVQAVVLGLTSADAVYREVEANLQVFLLLMYMVAAIFFMKDLLIVTFYRILLAVRNRVWANLLIMLVSAVLSAFLDALTVIAVLITTSAAVTHAHQDEASRPAMKRFLMSIVMSGGIGTALGGVCTLVGEPQNLLIANMAGWDFVEFAILMAPITIPCAIVGLLTCAILSYFQLFSYGERMDERFKHSIVKQLDLIRPKEEHALRVYHAKLLIQAIGGVLLVVALGLHLAAVGLIGLALMVFLTTFTGIIHEEELGAPFHEAMPFTALLVCFFAIVAVIHDQHLFQPVTLWVQSYPFSAQPAVLFMATGFLSAISDNVFVATVYMNEIFNSLQTEAINKEQFDMLAIAINTGTNLPSVATPNGQAAFLFLLTSSLAPAIGLSYMRMVWMAIPYTVVLSVTGFIAVINYPT